MSTSLTLAPTLTVEQLEQRYRACRDIVERTRWHALWLFARGLAVAQIEASIGLSDWSIRKVIHRFNEQGAAGVADQRHRNRGAPRLLSAAQQEELRGLMGGPAPDGGLWTGPKVARWMAAQLGRPVHDQQAWATLQQLGFTPLRPRPRHHQSDPQAQEDFKKGGLPPRSRP
jgi:transposase